jgi:ubiquitin C-terminal hydrolase
MLTSSLDPNFKYADIDKIEPREPNNKDRLVYETVLFNIPIFIAMGSTFKTATNVKNIIYKYIYLLHPDTYKVVLCLGVYEYAGKAPMPALADGKVLDFDKLPLPLFYSSITEEKIQKVLQMPKNKSTIKSNKKISTKAVLAPGTFTNLGNTCFYNALLWAIYNCQPFFDAYVAALNSLPPQKEEIVGMLLQLLEEMNNRKVQEELHAKTCQLVLTEFDYKMGQQQDASELLQYMVGLTNFDEAVISKPYPANLRQPKSDNIHGLLELKYLQCVGGSQNSGGFCDHNDDTQEQQHHRLGFWHITENIPKTFLLTVDIPNSSNVSQKSIGIEGLLKQLYRSEMQTPDNNVSYCNNVNAQTKNVIRYGLRDDQQFCVLSLKRFLFTITNKKARKNTTPVIFRSDGLINIPYIDLKIFNAKLETGQYAKATKIAQFKVVSVVVHSGTLNAGHYWSLAWSGKHDDERFTPGDAGLKNLLTTGKEGAGEGYLYFLERNRPAEEDEAFVDVVEEDLQASETVPKPDVAVAPKPVVAVAPKPVVAVAPKPDVAVAAVEDADEQPVKSKRSKKRPIIDDDEPDLLGPAKTVPAKTSATPTKKRKTTIINTKGGQKITKKRKRKIKYQNKITRRKNYSV